MDDILVYTHTIEHHQEVITQVLDVLQKHQLYLKVEKCTFECSTVEYLGLVLSEGWVEMDPIKIARELLTLQPPPPAHAASFIFFFPSFYCTAPVLILTHTPITHPTTHFQAPGDLPRGICMFVRSGSSPMALSGKTKQTSLDSFGRPPTRLTRRTAAEKGSRVSKSSSKQKEAAHQEQSGNLEGAHQEGADSPAVQGYERTVLSAEEGRAFLEEEAILDPEDQIDVDILSGALVQITLMEGMTSKESHAVCSIALMLEQVRVNSIGDSVLKSVEARMSTIVDKATKKMEAVANRMTEGLKAAAQGLANNTVKLTETTASYRDILAGASPRSHLCCSQHCTHPSSHLDSQAPG